MNNIINKLDKIIADNGKKKPEESYSSQLLFKGTEKCAEKFGEEAVELIIASLNKGNKDIIHEAADTLFHLNVLIRSKNISIEDVLLELSKREGISGLDEKKNRGNKR